MRRGIGISTYGIRIIIPHQLSPGKSAPLKISRMREASPSRLTSEIATMPAIRVVGRPAWILCSASCNEKRLQIYEAECLLAQGAACLYGCGGSCHVLSAAPPSTSTRAGLGVGLQGLKAPFGFYLALLLRGCLSRRSRRGCGILFLYVHRIG
jgi:hypothetical protein